MRAKILFLAYDFVPGIGAAGQLLSAFIPELSEHADVDAMSLKNEELPHIQRMGRARMMRVPTPNDTSAKRIATFQRAIARQLESESYHLVFCADVYSAHAVAQHPVAMSTKLVLYLHELPSLCIQESPEFNDGSVPSSAVLRRREMTVFKVCHAIIVSTATMRRHLLELNLPQQRVRHVPPGVDFELFAPPSVEVRNDSGACVVGVRIAPTSRHSYQRLLTSFSRLSSSAQIHILQDRAVDFNLPALLQALHLPQAVEVTNLANPQDLAKAFVNTDVLLFWWGWRPEVHESGHVPLEILAALASGRPIVAPMTRAIQELLPGYCNDLLFPPDNLHALTAMLNELISSSALRTRMGTYGRERANDWAHWSKTRADLTKILEEVCGLKLNSNEDTNESIQAETSQDTSSLEQAPVDGLLHTSPLNDENMDAESEQAAMNVSGEATPVAIEPLDGFTDPTQNIPWHADTQSRATQPADEASDPTGSVHVVLGPGLRSVELLDRVISSAESEEKTEIMHGMDELTDLSVQAQAPIDNATTSVSTNAEATDPVSTLEAKAHDTESFLPPARASRRTVEYAQMSINTEATVRIDLNDIAEEESESAQLALDYYSAVASGSDEVTHRNELDDDDLEPDPRSVVVKES